MQIFKEDSHFYQVVTSRELAPGAAIIRLTNDATAAL
jgi:hypothetical protein